MVIVPGPVSAPPVSKPPIRIRYWLPWVTGMVTSEGKKLPQKSSLQLIRVVGGQTKPSYTARIVSNELPHSVIFALPVQVAS